MDTHVANIKKLYEQSDECDRTSIKKELRALVDTLEGPQGVMFQAFNALLQLAVIRVGINLDLFSYLVKSKEALSIDQIAAKTGAAPELLARLLRYLSSCSILIQSSPTQFSPTPLCHLIASPQGQALLIHAFDSICPPVLALPSFLVTNNHQNITDTRDTPYQRAFNTSLPAFEHLAQPGNEKRYDAFQKSMTSMQNSDWLVGLSLLDDAAVAAEMDDGAGIAPEVPFFVDVGGGHGHQCVKLLSKYPTLKGKVVLEDLPEAVGKLESIEGVKIMVQDFFEEQAVKGAKFYYLRRILHDWPLAQSKVILANLAAAMDSKSRILLDEISLPDINSSPRAVMQDIALMVQMAGVERTRSEWKELVDGVQDKEGQRVLEVESVYEYAKDSNGCVTVLKLH